MINGVCSTGETKKEVKTAVYTDRNLGCLFLWVQLLEADRQLTGSKVTCFPVATRYSADDYIIDTEITQQQNGQLSTVAVGRFFLIEIEYLENTQKRWKKLGKYLSFSAFPDFTVGENMCWKLSSRWCSCMHCMLRIALIILWKQDPVLVFGY